jgi:DNA-directed RNA polymerase specialized sigma subunit
VKSKKTDNDLESMSERIINNINLVGEVVEEITKEKGGMEKSIIEDIACTGTIGLMNGLNKQDELINTGVAVDLKMYIRAAINKFLQTAYNKV